MNGFIIPCMVLGYSLIAASHAQSPYANEPPADRTLDLSEVAALAVEHQPLLEILDAQTRSARESAVAAAQLPDPQLFGGVRDLPINTDAAYSFRDDSDTQVVVGVSQEFPRALKRQLRGAQRLREADRLQAERMLRERLVRRDASLAWLTLWRDDRVKALAETTLGEAQLQLQAVEIGLRAGRMTQTDLLIAQLDTERQQDAVAASEQAMAQDRSALKRWIGDAADRALSVATPDFGPLPTLEELLERMTEHPELTALQARIAEADVGADLANAAYTPDWRVEVGYANRREFSDMVTVQVGMDLPLFSRNRQDRGLASALASRDAAAAQWDDGQRRLEADVRLVHGDYERLSARIRFYDETIVPQVGMGIDAALAAWRSGTGSLVQVINARRARLETEVTRLDLTRDAAHRRIELDYLNGAGG